jgi:hypothetical protein
VTPTPATARMPCVVLAGERPGGNALARSLGVPAGVLVEVDGEACLARVVRALCESGSVAGGVLCGPREEIVASSPLVRELLRSGDLCWLAPATGPAASAAAALEALDRYPALLTTGDHALLDGAIIDRFCALATPVDADLVVGLVPYELVINAFPGTRRTVLRFRDGAYCGSNLFLVRTPAGRAAILFWRRVESLRKQPWRMARELGWLTLIRYLLGLQTLTATLALLSRRAGCRVAFVPLPEPRAAVDVDSLDDRELAERVLRSGHFSG